MKKRKSTGKFLSRLLCLVTAMGMLVPMALADELGKVPGSSDTNTYEKADIEVEIPITKTVEQGGNIAPGEASFTFELLKGGNADGEANPIYQVLDTEEIITNGAGTTVYSLKFKVTGDLDGADGFGRNYIYLREQNGGDAGWTYSDALYRVNRNTQDGQTYTYSFDRVDGEDAGNHLEKATFTNTYTYSETRYELPFTKTVKLGGSAAPGQENFELEIFDVGVEIMEEHAKELYTAAVTTNGAGDYDGKLVISGPADQVRDLVCEGFYVREKNAGTVNWTYDDAVWYILPKRTDTEGSYIVDVDAPLVNNLPADTQPETDANEYRFAIYATKREESDNGVHYAYYGTPANKMTFTNTYTRSSGGGGGSSSASITVNKTDALGKPLAGASFVLKDGRGREAYQATSNASGIVRFTRVGSGTYTLLEKAAPEDYVTSDKTYELTVSGSRVTMDGKTYSPVTFVNRRAAELNRRDHTAFLVGYAEGTFGPERNMTRAEVTTMFARLLTEQIEADKTYSSTFNDVAKNCWAANYIGYMQQFGIVTGYEDGSFRPDAPVTRAEFAAIASRFEKLTQGSKSFTDVPDTHWAVRYINFAATRGWVTGYEDGSFKPEHSITRAEVAAVTCRLLERSADQTYIRSHIGELRTFADMTENHWAYWYAMEAANGHDYTKSGGSENWSRTHR
ncbi:MAG: S-layer homology domain-containing protein [Eubacteriales bacterium]